jgi:hypothetical protein
MHDNLRKIEKVMLTGLIAWAIMLPLFLVNYYIWGRVDWIVGLTWDEVVYFGIVTLVCLFAPTLFTEFKVTELAAFSAGILRWGFIAFVEIIYVNLANLLTPLFLVEFPIMIFSYLAGLEIMSRIKRFK